MKFLFRYVGRKVFSLTYTMHVRPHLEYGDLIYHDCSQYLMDMLESIQYQAGLISTGCWKNTNRLKLYNELGWESLAARRMNRRLFSYHKILTGNSPAYLLNHVLSSPPHPTSTQRYLRSFFPYCFLKYELLDPEIKLLDPIKFKNCLKT